MNIEFLLKMQGEYFAITAICVLYFALHIRILTIFQIISFMLKCYFYEMQGKIFCQYSNLVTSSAQRMQ